MTINKEIIDRFRAVSDGLLENEMMSAHTSFKIGGPADLFVSVKSPNETADLIRLANELDVPYMIIGNGSNMLVGDGGIRGLVIQIGRNISDVTVTGDLITAEAGAMMSKVAAEAMRASLSGFEEISGIPGTVGGAVFMNAGAYGGEIGNVVKTVTYIDNQGDMHTLQGCDCCFGYRRSIFSEGGKYIISVTFGLKAGNMDEIRSAMDEYSRRRSEKQPLSKPSAGSTFKRPEGYFAGKLIQDAGLLGYSIGGASVSEKHAGFIVNNGGATAADVVELIKYIQDTVEKKFGVRLEPEVRLIGDM